MKKNKLIESGEALEIGTFSEDVGKYNKKGFLIWQINGIFKLNYNQLQISDHFSGCGPTIIFNYRPSAILNSKKTIESFVIFLEQVIKSLFKKEFNKRIPTSIQFVQGITGYENIDYFNKSIKKLGFEIKTYSNIAHGIGTRDVQSFYFLDLTTYIYKIKEIRKLNKTYFKKKDD